jgi:phosphomannomutase
MIKFGTDGWRAIISDEFTFENVRKVGRAIALYLLDHNLTNKPLIIGYDPRFLADKFAEEITKIMENAGIDCYLTERDAPTPVVAWEVKDKKACGGIMITASHNPAQYCGVKFIPSYAGPANESITAEIQKNANKDIVLPESKKTGKIERFDPRNRYFKYIESFIDQDLIRRAGLKIVYDPMYGAARGFMDHLLQNFGCQVEVIHGKRDVLFGGRNPEPVENNLGELKTKVLELSADLGLANDGDADRFGVVDEKGNFVSANQVIPILFEYLVSDKGYTGSVARSVATTHLIDRIAERHNIKVYETPVGFKHIAKLMMETNIILGGEESGGISIKGHIPEKDGILANLLIVELIAKRKKPLSKIWEDLTTSIEEVHSRHVNLKLSEKKKNELMDSLKFKPPKEIAGLQVKSVNKLDGVKLLLNDGSWVLARPSGTEPLVRVYAESDKKQKLELILGAMQEMFKESGQ